MSLQAIEHRVFAASEFRFTGPAAQTLDGFMLAMTAVSDESVDGFVGDTKVIAG